MVRVLPDIRNAWSQDGCGIVGLYRPNENQTLACKGHWTSRESPIAPSAV